MIQKYCNKTCPKMCRSSSPRCWSCVAVCAHAQYYRDAHHTHKLDKCIKKGQECKEKMDECVMVWMADCSDKYGRCVEEGETCQGQKETLREMGEGVVLSEGPVDGKKRTICRLM